MFILFLITQKRKGLALQCTTFVVKMTTCSINHKEINFTEYFMLKFSILKKLSCSPESPNCYLLKGRLSHTYVSCNKSLYLESRADKTIENLISVFLFLFNYFVIYITFMMFTSLRLIDNICSYS